MYSRRKTFALPMIRDSNPPVYHTTQINPKLTMPQTETRNDKCGLSDARSVKKKHNNPPTDPTTTLQLHLYPMPTNIPPTPTHLLPHLHLHQRPQPRRRP